MGNFNAVVIADSPAAYAAGQLTALDAYEASFGVRQIDGYTAPYLGITLASSGALDGTTGTLTAAGLAALPELAGPIPFATGTNGYWSTVVSGAPFTPWLDNAAGQVLAGVYQHPATDAQANVAELELGFDYNATQLQWELLAPGLINWVTQDSHLGIDRHYVEMDIDDTFTPDNAWSTTVHDNDYSDADSLRMDAADVISSADWSNPTQENTPTARPAGEPATAFRLDQLFNYGGTVEYQNGELDLPGEPASCDAAGDAAGTCGPDPLLAQFQATDPATGKPYSDDFGWLSHTYDTPYLDVGCATEDYIEAELNENTADVTAAPGATPGTGGLGLPESTIASGASDVANPYGTYNPQVFVPGNHSGFADLDPGTPATVDPPDLDEATANTTGGTLGAGTYEYAVTDQFNGADSTATDQSQAYVTDGLQGDLAPVVVTGSTGSVDLVWQSICHAANYIIYRAPVSGSTVGPWTEIGTYATPDSATLPDNSSGDTSPAQTATVCSGPTYDPTSCAGEQELTFTDTGGTTGAPAGVTYLDTPMPAGWTPPVVENANELPWEQNPYFSSALTAAGITTVGADASKAYPDPANDAFGIGATYTGATYAAGQPFVDGTSQVAPRHPINVFYNAGTNAEELDEYNTLYTSVAPDSQCHDTGAVTCATTPYTFADVINQVVSGMFTNLLSNDPEISYVHQTNTMGTPPYSSILPPAGYVPAATAQPGTDGDGTLYEVLNPLISEYDSYFTADTPYQQLTLGGVGQVLADQTAWSAAQTAGSVTATEQNGVVTVKNTGTGAVNVPITAPPGTTIGTAAFGSAYDGQLSAWTSVAADGSVTLTEDVPPSITSADSATSIVGAAFNDTVTTTAYPVATLTESGALPTGVTFMNNGNGTATISGTPTTGTGGSYPINITATNTNGTTTQTFTLTNSEAPTIHSASVATFSTGAAGTYTVTTSGYPAATITESGALPTGLAFAAGTTGTATVAGTPATGTTGTYPVTISATNSSGSTATLALTITVGVGSPPTITSGTAADFTLGNAGSYAVTTTGSPIPAITETGTLPAGLTFDDQGNGTALLSGTPTATGTTTLDITAANSIAPNATQVLTVTVDQAPTITSAASDTVTLGTAFTFPVATTGYPAPTLTETGALPAGVSFVAGTNGTATLAGTPTATGVFPLIVTATSTAGTVTQNVTLTVNQAPTITSAGSATATLGTAFTFPVATAGYPAPTLTETGTLPAGVTFVDNGNGTATLAGTPTATGGFPLTITASSTAGTLTQPFTLSVDQAPTITSASSATATLGSASTFPVTTTGYPAPTLTEAGTLPAGVTFVDNGNGTATLAGTPTGTGVFPITITASSTAGTVAQPFTLSVDQAPTITSASSATATLGSAFTFPVTTTGYPAPTLTEAGTLPAGVTFDTNGSGKATLAGTPTATGGFPLTITATSAAGTVTQRFTLSVDQAPTITSAGSATATLGSAFTFPVTTTGYPAPALTETGALPAGVTFVDNGNGTATLAGTPTATGGFPITITATGTGTATQNFTLTVDQAPTITSASSDAVTLGTAFSFPVTTTGYPAPTLTEAGTLPAGVTFVDSGNGTATLAGTPTAAGGFPVTLTATSTAGTLTQRFTLSVDQAPTITSAGSDTVTLGTAFTFPVTTTGYPAPTLTETGTLPAGVTFDTNGSGTATLAGRPTASGGFPIAITGTSTAGTVTQRFTLTVDGAPTFTSAGSDTVTLGTTFSFPVTTTGYPAPEVTETGTLPAGVAIVPGADGVVAIAGTPTTTGAFALAITATNGSGTVTQHFALTVEQAPTITSAGSDAVKVGTAFSFKVATTGYPEPALTETGALPAGVTFVAGANGTATVSGTPPTVGTSTFAITAASTVGTVTQTFTLTVEQAPAITSASSYAATLGTALDFPVTATGYPAPTLTEVGGLPGGVTFDNAGSGTATIAGSPTATGLFALTVTATSTAGTVSQRFTLTVEQAPTITSASSYATKVGTAFSFKVTTTGYPAPALTETGALPAGVTFATGTGGTATIAGKPTAVTAAKGAALSITAASAAGTVTQIFTLTVSRSPSITSASSYTAKVGTVFSFPVTTTGTPAPTLTESGALPAGVSFVVGANGTAAITGKPTAVTAAKGARLSITAANAVGTVTQVFVLTVSRSPSITSASSYTAKVGSAFSFAVTTTGTPVPTLTETGALPAGITFVADTNGTATLAGTPRAVTSPKGARLSISAVNSAGKVIQIFTLTIDHAPAITSASSDTVPLGTAFTFPVTTTGTPTPALTETGTLPAGVTFVSNGSGTATLSGTPSASGGFPLTITASSTAGTVTQHFALTIGQGPAITSAGSDTVTFRTAFTFPVTATGYPAPTLTETGSLPAGVTFVNNGNGTATLAGTPSASGGFPLSVTASNGTGTVTQSFTLTVDRAPTVTSAGSDIATLGTAFNFPVTTTGYPTPALSETGTLPAGATFADNGNGTATIAGTPTTSGGFPLTITATSTAGTVTQHFTLTIDQAPTITSAGSDAVTLGTAFSFPVTTTGYPAPILSETGTLPAGVTFAAGANGTATIAGTPTATGTFPVAITATGTGGTVTQHFVLTIDRAPAITSANSDTVALGTAFSFAVTTTGYPAPEVTETGTLPAGITFGSTSGTATIAGTPSGTGVFALAITATNDTGTVTQHFTLTIDQVPVITSAGSYTAKVGTAFSFPVTTIGYPAPAVTETGALPAGVTYVAGANGAATLSGTPTTVGTSTFIVTATSTAGTVTQTFTLTVDQAPAITSAGSYTATAGDAFSFPVSTTGTPAPTLTETGALPAGATFAAGANGTAIIAGTPTATGTFALAITATSPAGTVTQTFTLTVDQAPTITSASSDGVTLGTPFTFPIATTGYPAPTLTETGTLPAGVTFAAGGNGAATLAGTPAATGTFPLAITATSTAGTVTQTFTLTVDQAPAITSAGSDTVELGDAFTFPMATTGYPAPTLTETGTLPAGVAFADGVNGTATIAGTATASGAFALTITATSTAGTVTQSFTLTVDQAPAVTSANSDTVSLGAALSFPVTTSGYPAPAVTETGALPAGVAFVASANGTAGFAGTPTATGTFPLTITATNGSGTVTQSFTLTVDQAPAMTSSGSDTVILGTPFDFPVTTSGYPAPAVTETGALPTGVTFVAGANGTATLSGTATTVGTSAFIISATSSAGTVTQSFTLTVDRAPAITSAGSDTVTLGTAFSFPVTTTGTPAPTLTETGALPAGVTFAAGADGAATLAGTPTATGPFALTITASSIAGTVTQSFTLTVDQAPTVTSAGSYTAKVGTAFSFPVISTGYPAPTLTEAGALPPGVTFVAGANGTATLSGTPTTRGTSTFIITAASAVGTVTQSFTLTIEQAPAITSAGSDTVAFGTAFSFPVTATGTPEPALDETGALPTGVTFVDNGNGTATLAGTPALAGVFDLSVTATNAAGTVTQGFTLTIDQMPAVTSAGSYTAKVGTAFSFPVTTTGYPAPAVTETGTQPTGVSFVAGADGTATLAGTPTVAGVFNLSVTATSTVGTVTQSFTLTIDQAPAITSAGSDSVTLGTAFNFAVAAIGYPAPAVTATGTMPAGVTFVAGANGTATLSGTPTTAGTSTFIIAATNGTATVTQSFTLTVDQAPTITSAGTYTAKVGTAFSVPVTTTGYPAPALTETGTLPAGVTFVAGANGTAILSGTPITVGSPAFTITATNDTGTVSQSFTLTIDRAPAITSATSFTATAGTAFSFKVTTVGTPAPALSEVGSLPPRVTFVAGANGTAILSGTPTTAGTSTFIISATNTAGTVTQSFAFTVDQAPAVTSAGSYTAKVGTAFSFPVTTTGYPAPVLTETGTLPAGVTFVAGADGTATLSGMPTTVGSATFTITAANGTGTVSQHFTLTIDRVPAITSAGSFTAKAGAALSFKVTTVGTPAPALTETGALPAGMAFRAAGAGTATIAGTPTVAGVFALTITATSTAGTASQHFTLTIDRAPAVTSADSYTAKVGTAFSFKVTTTGYPAPSVTELGALPAGVAFAAGANGTATIAGKPTETTAAKGVRFSIKATSAAGAVTQTFTLTIDK